MSSNVIQCHPMSTCVALFVYHDAKKQQRWGCHQLTEARIDIGTVAVSDISDTETCEKDWESYENATVARVN